MPGKTPTDTGFSLLTRHRANPLLTAADWPYPINTVFNPGVTKLKTGETLLLCRVEERSGRSHLCVARSADGISDWKIDEQPTFEPDVETNPEERWGVEDARIVLLDELGKYAVTYTAWSRRGPAVSLTLTEDFKTYERIGLILPPENKDAALLPRKVDGRWVLIHRPVPSMGHPDVWISYSPDLVHWGDHKRIMDARHGPWWDANKIGLSTPLLETPEGWLMPYHGVKETAAGCIYRMGLALLDGSDPSRCLMRSNQWIFSPETTYERSGDVDDVVFPCGFTVGDDGDTLNLYYGAADTSIALASGSIAEMLKWLKANRQ